MEQDSYNEVLKGADRLNMLGDSMWGEIAALARQYEPLNLGLGMPDLEIPQSCSQALKRTQEPGKVAVNQYTRGQGHPRTVKALATLYSPLFKRDIDPMTEILTTVGASEALSCTFMSMLNPGDEVILIEPFFDCYCQMIQLAGGVPVFVPLRLKPNASKSSDLYLDPDELKAAFNEQTKAIVVNTPHNPSGKVFSYDEISYIADLCKKYNCLYISDEVYEWLVYSGKEHVRAATLPGMWNRTITVGSGGKTFSITGWKIGWAIAPMYLIQKLTRIHFTSTFMVATPLQEALAEVIEEEVKLLGQEKSYWKWLQGVLFNKRNKLAEYILAAGMTPILPEAGYFLLADISQLNFQEAKNGKMRDYQFTTWLIKEMRLSTIPISAFYCKEHEHLGANFVRFCFIKEDDTLDKAGEIFKRVKLTLQD